MKKGRIGRNIALMVASALLGAPLVGQPASPPPGLLKIIAAKETQNAIALRDYTYRQWATVQEINGQGAVAGQYYEVRDITFSPNRVRYEQLVGQPRSTLTHIRMTSVDFDDIRNIQFFLLTNEKVGLYESQYKGEETVNRVKCFVIFIRPKQILSSQRFFEGLIWARESDYAIVQTEGQAVPQIETLREQNLTPHFTTIRREVDGKWMFPTTTYADDTLFFRNWPQRIRINIRYTDYRRFGAESTVTYGDESAPLAPQQR
ncbi:MAG: hypothetical protein JO319_16385 [Acidobacteriaceae bacterium]|nr:hypothetical protein [Acidobacteriaceae bacterium]